MSFCLRVVAILLVVGFVSSTGTPLFAEPMAASSVFEWLEHAEEPTERLGDREIWKFVEEKLPAEVKEEIAALRKDDPDEYREAMDYLNELVQHFRELESVDPAGAAAFLKVVEFEHTLEEHLEKFTREHGFEYSKFLRFEAELRSHVEKNLPHLLAACRAEIALARRDLTAFSKDPKERRSAVAALLAEIEEWDEDEHEHGDHDHDHDHEDHDHDDHDHGDHEWECEEWEDELASDDLLSVMFELFERAQAPKERIADKDLLAFISDHFPESMGELTELRKADHDEYREVMEFVNEFVHHHGAASAIDPDGATALRELLRTERQLDKLFEAAEEIESEEEWGALRGQVKSLLESGLPHYLKASEVELEMSSRWLDQVANDPEIRVRALSRLMELMLGEDDDDFEDEMDLDDIDEEEEREEL